MDDTAGRVRHFDLMSIRSSGRVSLLAYATAVVLLISGLVHFGVLVATHGSWSGPVSWRKPMTFGLSFGLTLATITWVSSYLPLTVRLRAGLLAVFAVACTLEVALITAQAWRRTPSHFNLSTPFDSAVARVLAVGGFLLVAVIVLLTVAAFRPSGAAPSMRAALRAGFVLLDVTLASGVLLLVTGLSRVYAGDQQGAYATAPGLKLLHGVTMHAILVLPLLALALTRTTWPEPRRTGAVRAAAGLYAVAAAAVLLLA